MDDISGIRKMYDESWDREDVRLQRHQLERDVTLRFLDSYLPPRGRILDIGAGTGLYALHLARRGYRVHAIDLSPEMTRRLQNRVQQAGLLDYVTCQTGDARDLSSVPGGLYDAALLMGPLYHLVLKEDRLLALKQASSCLKTGAVIFSAFVSRFGIWGGVLKKMPDVIHSEEEVASILERGCEIQGLPAGDFRTYFATVDEIAPLHEETGFEAIVVAGLEPCICADDEGYNSLAGETRRLWLDLMFKMSTEPSMIASSRHMLFVGRKKIVL